MNPVRIVIFAKAPRAGSAKTRLIPALGEHGAADVARQLFDATLSEALASAAGCVELCVTPAPTDSVWRGMDIPGEVQWSDQGDGDIGERMSRAARRVIEGGESVLLVGTDCLQLTAARLREAALGLREFDATMIPVVDGGYILLGLRRFHPSLFQNIAWSTESVAFETLCRLGNLSWTIQSYSALHDIDEPADLVWMTQQPYQRA